MKKALALALALAVVAVAAGIAVATPSGGVSASIVARGIAKEKVKTRGTEPYDAVTQQITIAPGGHTGWHTHPGNAIAIIKSGTLTVYEGDDPDCAPHAYNAGDVYIDPGHGHVHIGRNEGTAPLEILVTYVDVPAGGGAVRIDQPNPGNCSA